MTASLGKRDIALPPLRRPQTRPWRLRGGVWPWLALPAAALMLLPPLYLLVRTAEAPAAALEMLRRPTTLAALSRTALLSAAVTAVSAALALPIAWLTTQTDLRGRRFWTVATALPLVLPSYVVAYLFISLLGPRGLLQQWSASWGAPNLPNIYGFGGALAVLSLLSYPYILLGARAMFLRLDPALGEAARSLGYSPWQTFWRITLPQLRPGIAAGGLLVALYVLRDFGAVSLLRYDTLTRIIFIQYQSFSQRALSAVLGLLLVGLTLLLLSLELRTRGRARYDRRAVGVARRMRPVRLGRWQWAAQLYLGAVVTAALVAPVGGLLYWVLRGIQQEGVWLRLGQPAWGSATAAVLAALATTAAALPIAVITARRNDRFSQRLEQLTYLVNALPGLVVALALAFFTVRYWPSLYNSLLLLVLAYVVLFLPQVVGAVRASLLQLSPTAEEAARSLGHGPGSVLRRITLPLCAPGVLAGAALAFLTAMKELPATLILSPLGYRTLSMSIWSNISEAFFAQAAVPSLLLIVLSSVPLALLTLRERNT